MMLTHLADAQVKQVDAREPAKKTNEQKKTDGDFETQTKLPGIRHSPPQGSRFVKVGPIYMVPYEVEIPGEVKIRMQPIPGGSFSFEIPDIAKARIGKGDQRAETEPRYIEIQIAPFWMASHEITWGEYKRFMNLERYFKEFELMRIRRITEENEIDVVTAASAIYDPALRIREKGGSDDHPAASMSQFSAKQYTKYLSLSTGQFYRIPSAAQWQYACLAGGASLKPAVEKARIIKTTWHNESSGGKRQKVQSLKPNAWGLYDMRGNVCEWVLDGGNFTDEKWKKMSLPDSEAISWPSERFGRLACGGDFTDLVENCLHSSFKISTDDWWVDDPNFPLLPFWLAGDKMHGVGFRIIRPLHAPHSRKEQEKFWEIDCKDVRDSVKSSIELDRGVRGVIDMKLPQAIEKAKRP